MKNKPHIRPYYYGWLCIGNGLVGQGMTPLVAYSDWELEFKRAFKKGPR